VDLVDTGPVVIAVLGAMDSEDSPAVDIVDVAVLRVMDIVDIAVLVGEELMDIRTKTQITGVFTTGTMRTDTLLLALPSGLVLGLHFHLWRTHTTLIPIMLILIMAIPITITHMTIHMLALIHLTMAILILPIPLLISHLADSMFR
jgi:hypothetical protein